METKSKKSTKGKKKDVVEEVEDVEQVTESEPIKVKSNKKSKSKRKADEEEQENIVEDTEEAAEVSETKSKKSKGKKKVAEGQDNVAEDEVTEIFAAANDPTSTAEDAKKAKKKSRKRKGAIEDVLKPTVVEFDPDDQKSFRDFELDEMLLKGVGELGWERPTQVQESVIPLALEEKNLMVRARTGSGKTAAFVLPILHKIALFASAVSSRPPGPYAIFVAPTKELSSQIFKLIVHLSKPFPFIQCLNLTELSEDESSAWQRDHPEMVVTTPVKLKTMLEFRSNFCANVKYVVLDEADLLLSFGYDSEMRAVKASLPPVYQCILTSATLTDDMSALKTLFMTGPVLTIKLKEGGMPNAKQLAQYQLIVQNDEERFAILLSMLKLKLIVGKTIIFVKDPDSCFRMHLFLGAFQIKSCILNSSMPANSRCHVIDQFNNNLFSIIVASDADHLFGAQQEKEEEEEHEHSRRKKSRRSDKEAGVARGIDFHHVSNVVNFHFPTTVESYIHRVGRTARGWNKGTALSFCVPTERKYLDTIQEEINKEAGTKVLLPYEIRIKELDSFVLRTREALAACTKQVVREARLADIREEALRSAKLKNYFAANPRERDVLQSDKKLHSLKVTCPTMGDVPDYIVPRALRGGDFSVEVGPKTKNRGQKKRMPMAKKKQARDSNDPLKSFKV